MRTARPTSMGIDGLVLPGGESTTLSLLLESSGLFEPLGAGARRRPAGLRHLRRHDPAGRDGRSTAGTTSAVRGHRPHGSAQRVRPPGGFVRVRPGGRATRAGAAARRVHPGARWSRRAGAGVEVLATLPTGRARATVTGPHRPVVCRQGPVLVTAFHPELTADRRLHRLFVEMTKEERR